MYVYQCTIHTRGAQKIIPLFVDILAVKRKNFWAPGVTVYRPNAPFPGLPSYWAARPGKVQAHPYSSARWFQDTFRIPDIQSRRRRMSTP